MIDVEPLIRDELPRLLPTAADRADWEDVVGRAARSGQRWPRRPLVFALAAALAVLVAAAALAATLGGFDDWLRGAPGKPASEEARRALPSSQRALVGGLSDEHGASRADQDGSRRAQIRALRLRQR